jgi:RimJ/RimL family protein N-acetyltransferase
MELEREPVLAGHLHTLHKLSVMSTDSTGSRRPKAPLRGERTVIRPARTTDVEMLVRWHADPDVAPYWDGKIYTREQMRARASSALTSIPTWSRPTASPSAICRPGSARRLTWADSTCS